MSERVAATDIAATDIAATDTRSARSSALPLYVALHGARVKSSLLLERLFAFVRVHPGRALLPLAWALGGCRNLARHLAQRVTLTRHGLPLHEPLLHYLRGEAEQGRRIYLVHGGERALAEEIAGHLGLFSGVVEAPPAPSAAGSAGVAAFAYAGQGGSEARAAWARAGERIAVNAGARTRARLRAGDSPPRLLDDRPPWPRTLARALRVHQWVKNFLIFVPMLTAHEVFNLALWPLGVAAWLAFSLCASATYLLNDLLDLDADRQHETKRTRPLAAGELGLGAGLALSLLALAAASACVAVLPAPFLWVLGAYLALTVSYSLHLKRVAMLDVVVLAALYTLRIVAGNVTFGIEFSEWLLALSVFLFLSLALVKRYSELHALRARGGDTAHGRGYRVQDLELLGILGATSGYLAVLVLALYITSTRVQMFYAHPDVLWTACLIMLYWIGRLWLLTGRGEMHTDPVVFALTDRVSYAAIALVLVTLLLASGAVI
jgi:4-hydroxybenzoate polyprenyltransferase